MLIKIPPIAENACSSKEGSSDMDSDGFLDELLSCDDLAVTDNDPCSSLVVPYIVGSEDLVGAFDSISIEPSFHRDDEITDYIEFDHAPEPKYEDSICPSLPSRRSGTSTVNQKDQIRRTARLCGKSTPNTGLPDSILTTVERKRRSYSCKQARSSVWGSLDHILQSFEHNNSVANLSGNVRSRKARAVRGSGQQKKKQVNKSSASLKEKNCTSSGRLRIKIKIGKQVGNTCTKDMVSGTDNGLGHYCSTTMEDSQLDNSSEVMLKKNVLEISGFQKSSIVNGDDMVMLSDNLHPNTNLTDKVLERTLVQKLSAGNEMVSSQIEVVGRAVAAEKSYTDAETSPDSEVINIIPEVHVNGEVQKGNVMISSSALAAPADISSLDLLQASSKEGKEKNLSRTSTLGVEDRIACPDITRKGSVFDKEEQEEKVVDGVYLSEASISTTTAKVQGDMSSSDSFLAEPLFSSRSADSAGICDTSRAETGIGDDLCSTPDLKTDLPEPDIFPCNKAEERKHQKHSNRKGHRNQKESDQKHKGNRGKSGTGRKLKDKGSRDGLLQEVECHADAGDVRKIDSERETTNKKSLNLETFSRGLGQQHSPPPSAWVLCDDCSKWRRIEASLADSIGETDCRWTCNDNLDQDFADCSIPQEKSNAAINAELEISDASGGEDDCDAPLNSKRSESKYTTVPEQSSWKIIKSNFFLHRSRKNQSIDEVMVCHCKLPPNGRMGCGDGCLNRMLNIECVKGTCPCGERCSNQQFQKRDYAKLKWFRCGKKGYGLQSLETISEGQFLIEYVGEVLDMVAYEARQRDYASKGHKHFYFMTLNGSEVIDACAKGNLGRFINHSCDPNCRTEKWMVNGEVCIGLFALRKISKGEELTFDYNYVRVFGAAAKKCVCGSPLCRGYIGGDPSNTEVTVQGDSDEEFPEPVMVYEEGEVDDNLRSIISSNISFDTEMQLAENTSENSAKVKKPTLELQTAEKMGEDEFAIHKSSTVVQNLEIREGNPLNESVSGRLSLENDNSLEKSPSPVLKVETFSDPEHTSSKSISNDQEFVQRSETSPSPVISVKSWPDRDVSKHKCKVETIDEKFTPKLRPHVKTSRSSSSVKKEKSKSSSVHGKLQMVVRKSHGVSHKSKKIGDKSKKIDDKSKKIDDKSKKIDDCSLHGRFEAVEVKLNELLDAYGGISKRKDATRGYLKLLLLTAASGDSGNGEGIQSNRDLSMILDALLKTKSRMVLVDVINKNGLQMLHNIMKRYRRDFKKIPILRKLLKVLEYLAMREILTLEHITGGPLCPGMESFRESILTFTEHDDKQVHQIARNFRDRWIPRHARKVICMDRIDGKGGLICNKPPVSPNICEDQVVRGSEAISCINQSSSANKPAVTGTPEDSSASCISACPPSDIRPRKRKSRWDQPAEVNTDVIFPPAKELKILPSMLENSHLDAKPDTSKMVLDSPEKKMKKEDYSAGCAQIVSLQMTSGTDGEQNIDEDVPPGFFPLNSPLVPPPNVSIVPGVPGENSVTAKCPSEVVMGHPHGRFMNRLPVSYGIPLPVVQQFGTLQAGTLENWAVAPGLPFQPFPPLPPFPHHISKARLCAVNAVMSQPEGNNGLSNPCPPFFRSDHNPPCTSGGSPTVSGIQVASNQHRFHQHRGNFGSGNKRPFRQHKWNNNNSRSPTPWGQKRDTWGSSKGNDLRNRTCNIGVATTVGNTGNSQGIASGVGSGCNNFQQHPHQQNHQ